ncbi:hypothetical protein J4429_05890 [Candidatus Pacearchaeota archaeon]|nr:hypothetical protein [Candidatus Pacearchaeota archaeon]
MNRSFTFSFYTLTRKKKFLAVKDDEDFNRNIKMPQSLLWKVYLINK